MTKTNVQSTPSNSQRHDTPNNKTHVIKFRVTAEEKASLELTCKLLNLSLSTFIRRSIHNVKIEKTVIVAGGEETLTKGKLDNNFPVIVGGGYDMDSATVMVIEKKKGELRIKVLNTKGEILLNITV